MKTKIFIVDDHPIFREGLKSLIESENDMVVCCEAADANTALSMLSSCPADLMTVDLSLTEGSGIQLIKHIRLKNKQTKILVSSMHDEQLFAERCIRAGANGYINKEEASNKIIEAIRTVMSGRLYLSHKMVEHLAQRHIDGAKGIGKTPQEVLSNRELEVFMLIGEGHSSQKIAAKLNLSSKTIDTHKEHIKKKLGIYNRSELVKQAVTWVMRETYH